MCYSRYFQMDTAQQVVEGVCNQSLKLERPLMDIPDELWELMCECWKFQPADRPTFQEIRQRLSDISVPEEDSSSDEVDAYEESEPVLDSRGYAVPISSQK